MASRVVRRGHAPLARRLELEQLERARPRSPRAPAVADLDQLAGATSSALGRARQTPRSPRLGADVRRQRADDARVASAAVARGRGRDPRPRSSRRRSCPPRPARGTRAARRASASSSRVESGCSRADERRRSRRRADRLGLLQAHRARVELGDDAHDADAGVLVAGHDRPLDRRGAAPARQQRRMDVDQARDATAAAP